MFNPVHPHWLQISQILTIHVYDAIYWRNVCCV